MFYDKIKKGVTFTENENTVPWDSLPQEFLDYAANQSDKSYDVSYDVNGLPVVKRLQLDENGERFAFYTDVKDADGFFTSDVAANETKATEDAFNQLKETLMKAVETYVQSEVNKYNKDNNILFRNVDSCAKYISVPTYTHYQFCLDIVTWNASVWEAARAIEAEVLAGTRTAPTEEELIAELPVFGGV